MLMRKIYNWLTGYTSATQMELESDLLKMDRLVTMCRMDIEKYPDEHYDIVERYTKSIEEVVENSKVRGHWRFVVQSHGAISLHAIRGPGNNWPALINAVRKWTKTNPNLLYIDDLHLVIAPLAEHGDRPYNVLIHRNDIRLFYVTKDEARFMLIDTKDMYVINSTSIRVRSNYDKILS